MAFFPGDTVRLKSGGPLMTVKGHPEPPHDQDELVCRWFDKDGHMCSENFEEHELAPAVPTMPADPNAPPVSSLDHNPDESLPSIGNFPGGGSFPR